MSPVRTAARVSFGRDSRVLSSKVVLPEPGELIRLRHKVPLSPNRSRSLAAIRSFSLRIFFSSGSRLMLLHFQVDQLQLVSTEELGVLIPTFRAAGIELGY